MADRSVKIEIVATADTAPIERTSTALDEVSTSAGATAQPLGASADTTGDQAAASTDSADALTQQAAAAEEATKATDKAAPASVKGADGFKAMGAASAAASGSIQGTASAMAQLLPKLQALQAALPVVGMAIAAFTAWKKVFDLLEDIRESQERGLRDITSGNMAAGVDTIAESFRRMRGEIDEAYDAQNALLGHIDAMVRADQRKEMAEMRQQKELDSRGVSDPAAKAKLEADYGLREAQMRDAWAKGDAMRQQAAIESQAEQAQKVIADEKYKQSEIAPRMLAVDQEMRRTEQLQADAPDKKKASFDAELEKLRGTYKELNEQMVASGKAVAAASQEFNAAQMRMAELNANRAATSAENRAGIMGAQGNVRSADPGMASQDARVREGIAAREAKLAELRKQNESLSRNADQNVAEIAGYFRDMTAANAAKMQALANEIRTIKDTIASQPGG